MGLLSVFRNIKLRLTESEREYVWRAFGSFQANKLALEGNNIIENSYEKNVDVYSVIKKIIDVTKSIPWIIEQQKFDGTWKELKDSTLHDLMENPNVTKGYTWNDIEEQILIYLLTCGNTYLYGQQGILGNTILELDILPSNNVDIITNSDFFLPQISYKFSIDGKKYSFEKDNISHIKFFNPSYYSINESYYGLSPIEVASMVVKAGNDKWEADAALLQNKGAIGMITDGSNRPMTSEEAKQVQLDFNKQTGGTHNFGKIKVTNKDLKYIQMAMSSNDLQLIEKGVINMRAICNVFGIDSSLFNDPENKTYSNRRDAERSLYTNCIMPLSDKISESLTRFLCPNHFPGKKVRLRQNFSNIECLQENFKEKAEIYSMLKTSGIITANVAAEALKQPISKDENADKLIVSNQNILVSDLDKQNNQQQNNNNINA